MLKQLTLVALVCASSLVNANENMPVTVDTEAAIAQANASLDCYTYNTQYTTCVYSGLYGGTYRWDTNYRYYGYQVFYPSPGSWPYSTNNSVIRFLHVNEYDCPKGMRISVTNGKYSASYQC